jgi:hypothetical protein
MFRDRRHIRRWAARVLLVWLFGLAVGVANACALGESVHHRPDASDRASHPEAQHDVDQGAGDGHANCQDFCEKASLGAVKLKLVDDGQIDVDLAAPLLGSAGKILLPEPPLGRVGDPSLLVRSRPPLRIALQRLAL